MKVNHGFAIGQRVRFFHEKWDQHMLMYVVGYQHFENEPRYVLSIDKTIIDKYPHWIKEFEVIEAGGEINQQFGRWAMPDSTVIMGVRADSISFQELVDPEEIRSKKWTYKHIHGMTFEIHFDIEVNQKYVENFIHNNECPPEQVVPGTIYPVASNEVKQNTENQVVSKMNDSEKNQNEPAPPGYEIRAAGHHWLDRYDSDGHYFGRVVLQWNPGAKKWSHSGNVGSNMFVNTSNWKYVALCPIPE